MLGFNDDITSPLSAQIFDFSDQQLFPEIFNLTSENSNKNNTKLQYDEDDNNNNRDLSRILDSQEDFENDRAASIEFSTSSLQYPVVDHILTATPSQDQFDYSSRFKVVHQPPNILYGDSLSLPAVSSVAPPLLQQEVFEEVCLSSVPSYNLVLNPSFSVLSPSGLPAYMVNMSTGLVSAESNSGYFQRNLHLGSEINKPHDQLIDFQADNGGLFCPDSITRFFSPGDLQEVVTPQAHPSLEPVKINSLEDSTLNKVEKLSAEQRKEKIHRYMKKRNERNFSKKIKYACRKTLADIRPRVRGRFAKNDEFGEPNRQATSNHHDYEDEDDMGVKDEEQFVDSSDIFAQISGANSFNCNYPIQSWI